MDATSKMIKITIDNRENASNVPEFIRSHEQETDIIEEILDVGDYICSDRVCIERKTCADFIESIKDNRLFSQIENMKNNFEKPLFIIEGDISLFKKSNMNDNSLRGFLISITLDFNIPLFWSADTKETAEIIIHLAKREQIKEKRAHSIRVLKKRKTTREIQEFIVSGLPDINTELSRRVLGHFGSPKALFNALPEDLIRVEGIGREKAKKIFEILNLPYL